MISPRVFPVLLAAISCAAQVSGGQIPVQDGVLGGVAKLPTPSVEATSLAPDIVTTPGQLRGVVNSGLCETTPNVAQASGYGDIAADKSIFFWYFAARGGASTAPLTLWFNGGPGASSMLGLLQEIGPCRINSDGQTVSPNPQTWNERSHLLFIDQPVGVGFSHSTTNVNTSQAAAHDVWLFMQIFLADSRFSSLATNPLAIWTESYGGHYGPAFAAHFLSQNAANAGIKLNLKSLGIGNGMTDPASQYAFYPSYAAFNPYHLLVPEATYEEVNTIFNAPGGCASQIAACNNGGSNAVCSAALSNCNTDILAQCQGPWNPYYVLDPQTPSDNYPPEIGTYIESIASQIGAEVGFTQISLTVYDNFAATGDWMRSSLPDLTTVIEAGLRVNLYVGDADYLCNYFGIEFMITKIPGINGILLSEPFSDYYVDGMLAGLYKNANNFSYLRMFRAGHEVPAYGNGSLAVGEAASQMFTQVTVDGWPGLAPSL
ncbi:Carboxypeptidase [Mycena sanguinolenta]|uniref:Carboxypeptidase n=1 Tax=Mycena sanguinolenta TaxID=230812 RepID=A0A8H6YZS0_9AGAR|nr:Carboxypeptidase [Mycena sanguinolenta]